MPRYFFQLDDDTIIGDPKGLDLPSEAAARKRATKIAVQLAGKQELIWRQAQSVVVTDEAGSVVLSVHIPHEVPAS